MGDPRLDLALHGREWATALRLIEERRGLRHTDSGWCVLHTAVWQHAPVKVCEALLQYIDPNTTDDFGESPLHYAVRYETSEAIVRTLLAARANPNLRSSHGATPLFLAINCFAPGASIAHLLRYGARETNVDGFGTSAIQVAKKAMNDVAISLLNRVIIATLLCASRIVPRRANRDGFSRLPPELVHRIMTFI